MEDTFNYFAYGSNLLQKRIQLDNPTATRVGAAQLKDYRLDFNGSSDVWNGAPATIVEDVGSTVWGAVWEIDSAAMANLDRQEGVASNVYKAIEKSVEMADGQNISCRIYQQVNLPQIKYSEDTLDRLPSKTYMDVIRQGAVESGLPEHYINELNEIRDNSRMASTEIRSRLDLPNIDN